MVANPMPRKLIRGLLRISPLRSLNFLIDNEIIRVRTFEDLCGVEPIKAIAIPEERVHIPELEGIPIYLGSKHIQPPIFESPSAYTVLLNDVLYDPVSNLLLSKDREVLSDSLFPHHPLITSQGRWNSVALAGDGNPYWYNFHRKAIKSISGLCSIFRGTYRAHFHSLVSNIPRASLLSGASVPKAQRIRLLFQDGLSGSEAYFLPGLLRSNVEMTPVTGDYLYRIEQLIFPSYLNQKGSGYLPQAYLREFRCKFMPKRPRSKRRKIFISRRNYARRWGKRHILNEEDLFSGLQKLGFRRYFPETMSIAEQIDLFYDARTVVGAHGSGLTNILYSDEIDVLEINPECAIHPYFYLLSKSISCRYKFWFAKDRTCTDDRNLFSNFSVNVEEILDTVSTGFQRA